MSSSPKHARPIPREEEPTDQEITIERQTPRPLAPPLPITRKMTAPFAPTRRVPVVDAWLIAVAKGEIDPEDDPFGGLIPVDDDGNEIL